MPSARRRGRCTHGLDGQHQYVDKTVHGRVSENDLGQRYMEKVVHSVANSRIEDG